MHHQRRCPRARGAGGLSPLVLLALLALMVGLALPATGFGVTATVKVFAGGDRTTSNTATGYATDLKDVVFQWAPSGTTAWSDLCTTLADGTCTVTKDFGSGVSKIRVRVKSAPAGFNTVDQISFSGGSAQAGFDVNYWGTRADLSEDPTASNLASTPAEVSLKTSGTNEVRATSYRGGWNNNTVQPSTDRFVLRRDNPQWPNQCGVRIRLVLDVSGSTNNPDGTKANFINAAKAFIEAMKNTPTTLEMQKFSYSSSDLGSFDISTTAGVTNAKAAVDSAYANPSGGTNWDGALWDARTSQAEVVVFLTDGNPTVSRDYPSGSGYIGGSGSTVTQADVTNAIASANLVKKGVAPTGGSAVSKRIVVVGAGPNISATNLKVLSGPTLNDDYFMATDLSKLTEELQKVASRFCGATVNVKKFVDGSAVTSADPWTFGPKGPVASGVTSVPTLNTGTVQTDNLGVATISLNNVPVSPGTSLTVAETPKAGVSFKGATCKKRTNPAASNFPTVEEAETAGGLNNQVVMSGINRADTWDCTFSNRKDVGSLVITKTLDAPTGVVPAGTKFKVDVKCTKSGSSDLNYNNLEITYPTPGSVTQAGIPEGYSCTVTEQAPTVIPGYTWESATFTGNPASIVKNQSAAVGVKNTLTRDLGNLEVVKSLSPSEDPGTFDLSATGTGLTAGTNLSALGVGDGEGIPSTVVPTGTYTVAEAAAEGSGLANYTSSIACYQRTDEGVADEPFVATEGNGTSLSGVAVAKGEDVLCVISNTRKTVDVTVQKQVIGGTDDPTTFDMTFTGQEPFALADDQSTTFTVNVGDEQTLTEQEITDEGYAFDSIYCTDGESRIGEVDGQSISFTPSSTDDIFCRVVNTRLAKLIVKKDVLGTDATDAEFGFTLDSAAVDQELVAPAVANADFTLVNGGSKTLILDPSRDYTLDETAMPDGYGFVSVSCTLSTNPEPSAYVDFPIDQNASQVNLGEFDAGDIVTCTYTNQKLPTVKVTKQVVGGNGDATKFDLSLTPNAPAPVQDAGPFQLADNQSETFTVAPGSYTLAEGDVPAGYQFTDIACTIERAPVHPEAAQDSSATIGLEAGDNADCVVTNTKLPTLKVSKTLTGASAAGDTSVFPITVNGTQFASLKGGEASAVTIMPIGTYQVVEGAMPANLADGSSYAFTSAVCTVNGAQAGAASGQGVALDLKAGENAVCVFTNAKVPPVETGGEVVPPAPPVVTPVAKLAITKTAPKKAVSGKRFVYTIRVRNTSKVVARQVVMTDPLPRGLVFVRSTPKGTVKGRTVTVKLGNMKPGQVKTVKVTVRSIKTLKGKRVNVATAVASNAKAVRAKAPTVFRPVPKRVIKPAVTG